MLDFICAAANEDSWDYVEHRHCSHSIETLQLATYQCT